MNKLAGQITLESSTKVLAYCHYYTIPFLSGRGLPASHLQRLMRWLGLPDNKIQTIRHHRFLAAHLVLLQAAGLVQHDNNQWFCSPFVEQWLQQPPFEQYQTLIAAIDRCGWKTVVQRENLSTCFDEAYSTFVRQSLERQQNAKENQAAPYAFWESLSGDEWQLALPAGLPPEGLFHLLQLGEWHPPQPLRLTATTIAKARQHGYSVTSIEHLLTEATQQALTQPQQAQLLNWYLAAEHYQIQAAYLLSTAQPDQLAEIMTNRRLSQRIHEQISPRQAIVSSALITPLARWLAKQNKHLQAPHLEKDAIEKEGGEPSCRRIQPLRLESRGNLYYLYAYCYRAETNLTFRLDRITHLEICS